MNTYRTTREVFDDLPFFYFAVANAAKSPSLYIKWENERNLTSAFSDDKELTNMTMALDDGYQVESHNVVLLSSSALLIKW